VSGLCFEEYGTTLSDQANPGYLNKNMFLASGRTRVDKGTRESLAGVRDAVSHLHSLGIIHNDIKPENIMIVEMGRFILIDFDSCGLVGEALSTEGE
jgi:serine/threonine protein kinase